MERERQRNRYDLENERRSHEMNGNSPSFLGKRKKSQEKKRCAYLQEWLENSWAFQQTGGSYGMEPEPVDNVMNSQSSSYWPPHATVPVAGQRLFTAVSDPAVCRYSVPVPVGYSLESFSLPLYPVYQSPMPVASGRPNFKPISRPPTRGRPPRRSHRGQLPSYPPPVPCDSWQTRQSSRGIPSNSIPAGALPQSQSNVEASNGQEFASLPPVVQSGMPNSAQRRFSDPGLGPLPNCSQASSGSSDSHSSRDSSPTTVGLVLSLVEQVNALQDSNRRLFRELHDTRVELEGLKLQAASWRQLPPDYEPGMLSDLVREVRDAARVREEALLSRVRGMLGNSDTGKWGDAQENKVCSAQNSERSSQGPQDIQELKDKLQMTLAEKNHTDERLMRVEDQLKNLRLQNSSQTQSNTSKESSNNKDHSDERPLTQQLHELEKEKLQLRCELQEALASRKDVEAHAQKMERLVVILRKKINGVTQDEKLHEPVSLEQSPSSLENTSESLVSVGSGSTSTGRSSIHSPQVTMSGPVTDL